MRSLSNSLIGLLSIITAFMSILTIGIAWYLRDQSVPCEKSRAILVLYFGIVLLVVSLLGLIGFFHEVSFFVWIYLFLMLLLVIALFCFTIVSFVVGNKSVGVVVSGRGYKEYRLRDYPYWMQKMLIGNAEHWEKIKSCLNISETCRSLGKKGDQTASEFYQTNLWPIQSGCCKPPTYCGFTYKNATFWMTPKSGAVAGDSDCKTWSNDQDQLCYDCESCKAGVVADIVSNWKEQAFWSCIYLGVILLLIFLP